MYARSIKQTAAVLGSIKLMTYNRVLSEGTFVVSATDSGPGP